VEDFIMSEQDEKDVEDILREARENPPSKEESKRLLTNVLTKIKEGAERRGDTKTLSQLSGNIVPQEKRGRRHKNT